MPIKLKILANLVAGILLCSCAEQVDKKFYYPTIKKNEILGGDVEISQQVSFAEADKKWKIQFVVYIDLQDGKSDHQDCALESYSLNFDSEVNTQAGSILEMERSFEKLSFIGGKALFSYIGQVNLPENFKSNLQFQLNDKCGTKSSVFDYEATFKPKKKKVSFLDRAFFGKTGKISNMLVLMMMV